jgi:hypothetical protein
MKVSGKILLFILIFSGFPAVRCGATVYHSDGSVASVQGLHNAALNGDTITLPAGTFTWTTRLNLNKAITLQGAGIGATIIRDAVQSGSLISWTLTPGHPSRMTGIEFQDGGRGSTIPGILTVTGSNTNGSTFRMDHCKLNDLNGYPVFDTLLGVIDHCTFVISNKQRTAMFIYGNRWNNQSFGDGSWAAPTNFGSSAFLFLEDNNFVNNGSANAPVTDAYGGARFVVRHNTIFNSFVTNHGTESTGRIRGGRAVEVYRNTFTGTNLNRFVGGLRSGIALFHDNNISGYTNNPIFTLTNFRNYFPFTPWAGADGTNTWDVNEPNVFFTGTAASNSSGTTVTVPGVNWTPNQWAGYTIRRTSDVCNSGSLTFAFIDSNTANTITYTDNGGYPWIPTMSFCAGDTLEIRRVDHALDQPGRAVGSLITGDPPIRPANWNSQVTEPCYAWNNGAARFNGGPGVRASVHYFNNTPMPGYSEYTYPHPLVTGAVTGAPGAVVRDFNGDGHPDYVLQNVNTRQTAIWYLNNNVYVSGAYGPTRPAGWALRGLADFNGDSHSDYALFAPNTNQTAIWYLSGPTLIAGAYGPTLPNGWELVGTADCNGDSRPDYVLYNSSTHQTAIWYLNNNVYIGGGFGPTLPNGWELVGTGDFNGDGHPDYVLFHPSTGYTAIVYLSGLTVIGGAWGPTIPSNWALVATGDFNGDGKPDYVLYNAGTRQTAIWYLLNNVFLSGVLGPTIPIGWSLTAP